MNNQKYGIDKKLHFHLLSGRDYGHPKAGLKIIFQNTKQNFQKLVQFLGQNLKSFAK